MISPPRASIRANPLHSRDLDLVVIGTASFEKVVGALLPLRERLGREVNPVVMSRKAFVAQRKRKEHFLMTVMGTQALRDRIGR